MRAISGRRQVARCQRIVLPAAALLFYDCAILTRYSALRECETFEAFEINKKGKACVCEPSVSLLEKEIVNLS